MLEKMTDIDDLEIPDLIKIVYDYRTKELIREAYKNCINESYKSAIMMTWVAISFDIFIKTRVLAKCGEESAIEFLDEIEKAYKSRKGQEQVKVERNLLPKARDQLELLSGNEFDSLERVKNDRNKCVHPDFSGSYELFNPSQGEVNLHITNALKCLLIYPAKQGKFAVEDFKEDILNQHLPPEDEDFRKSIRERHLSLTKKSLVADLIECLLNLLFEGESYEFSDKTRYFALALSEISHQNGPIFDDVLPQALKNRIHSCAQDRLLPICSILKFTPKILDLLTDTDVNRINRAISMSSFSDLIELHAYEGVFTSKFQDTTIKRIKRIDNNKDKIEVVIKANHESLTDQVIEIFGQSKSTFESEDLWRRLILPYTECFTSEDIGSILNSIQNNHFISGAGKTPYFLLNLFKNTIKYLSRTKDCWSNFIDAELESDKKIIKEYTEIRKKIMAFENLKLLQ